jgi:hypothetical protein
MSDTQIGSGPFGQGPINAPTAGAAAPATQARVRVSGEAVKVLFRVANEAVES